MCCATTSKVVGESYGIVRTATTRKACPSKPTAAPCSTYGAAVSSSRPRQIGVPVASTMAPSTVFVWTRGVPLGRASVRR